MPSLYDAGTWRGLPVAVKSVVFHANAVEDAPFRRAAAEASVAYGLQHTNIVTTFSHELKQRFSESHVEELLSWELYLVSVRTRPLSLVEYCLAQLGDLSIER